MVGTGRCGSTLLTRMLSCHRDLVGVNEVFTGLDWGIRFTGDEVDGATVAEILGTPNDVVTMVVARGHEAEEVTYPFGTGRYSRGDELPWILTSTLGHLSGNPDELWDDVSSWLAARPPAPIAEQYRALFEHLAHLQGASCWVERSGSSIDYLGDLLDCFAPAPRKVVHIHRDGAEVALSMRNHAFYRLAVQLYYGVIPDGVDPQDEEAVVDAWLGGDPPLELFGRYWSEQIANGVDPLGSLSEQELLTVGFSDLVADPATVMTELEGFFELAPDDGFVDRAASLVRGIPPMRAAGLAADELSRVQEACAPGRQCLLDLDLKRS